MIIPDKLIHEIMMVCQEHDIAFAVLRHADEDITLMIMGPREMHVNDVSLKSASMLLNGVINGAFLEANNQTKADDKKDPTVN